MTEGVSIIVCCFNSAKRLPNTLKHLAEQQVPDNIPWEIIVVDNASTDDISSVAIAQWEKNQVLGVEFRVIKQPIPGLSNAREKGFIEARYEFLLFCDDDNWLCSDYVNTAFKIMSSDPLIGALGGCGIFEPEQPINTQIEKYKTVYVNGSQTWAANEHWVYGAGALYRKSLLIALKNRGWEQITSDRIGNKLICGGDVEICFMLYLTGYQILSDNRLTFKHYVPIKRQSLRYISDLSFWISYSHVLLTGYIALMNKDKRPIQKILNGWFMAQTLTLMRLIIPFLYQRLTTRRVLGLSQARNFRATYATVYSLIKNRNRIIKHHKLIKEIILSETNTLEIT